MRNYFWSKEKNNWLKFNRNISFEDIVEAIGNGFLVRIENHHNPVKFPNQKLLIIRLRNYIYVVPYVKNDKTYFLKTIFADRKRNKKYLKTNESKTK